ncbi:3'-5' exoribonuclease [Halobacillus shinanisalinarum]|uniref:3'-5' exoribonuclease n=1 Tax=Halobacillus shinanisalinarum TaxID=2932258 RepID=A0ABY4GXR7_9BACI|nr:exonuclease domain-containing protein [Halobacillus shinanisalinarum]UOQ91582.1 3'-5' exoribonuclease [Halobacillus shinanisalinarum]
MNFVAIDFETANTSRSSVCSIGLVEYADGELVDEYYKLVKPRRNFFNGINTSIHGITEEDVTNEKEFNQLWEEELRGKLDGKLVVAHNASFDMSVLRNVLDEYRLPYPNLTYNCTVNIAKKTWLHLGSYNLKSLSQYLNIQLDHHHALEDAQASAIVLLKACEYHAASNINELIDKTKTTNGAIFPSGYRPARLDKKKRTASAKDLIAATTEFDQTHPFYQSTFVFTGTLESLKRKDAMQRVLNLGGFCSNSVHTSTNYLVMGSQDYTRYKDGKKSSKLKKVELLIEQGYEIEIMAEDKFLTILNGN